jgi:uncharacterized protein (DUF58 family)
MVGPAFRDSRLRTPLGVAARKHDVVAVSVNDPAELELPAIGLVEFEDAETGRLEVVDTRDRSLRKRFKEFRQQQAEELKRLLRQLGVDHIALSTAEDFTARLHTFFQQRARRYRG